MKRIYFETVKKWALISGVPAGIFGIALLFLYLSSLGSIEITGYSEDTICAGTINNPCYAYINFTAKEDIFIYPFGYDPYGRNTPFYTDKGLKSWKIYRSWGKGWREIKLNQTCTSTWCGAPPNSPDNKYAFAFRKGRDYQIKIVGYKNNPEENIKWGFGPIDPEWKGINKDTIFIKLISNKAGLTSGKSIFEVYNPFKKNISINDLNFDFQKDVGESIKKYEIFINSTEIYFEPIYSYEFIKKNCITNKTKEIYDCSYTKKIKIGNKEKTREIWTEPKTIPSGKHKIKLVGYWKPHLGKQRIEWIPSLNIKKEISGAEINLNIIQSDWAWWNAEYNYRRNIIGLNEHLIFPINSTNATDIDNDGDLEYIYAFGGDSPYIYYNNGNLTAVANDSTEFFKVQTFPIGATTGTCPDNLTLFMPLDRNIGKAVDYSKNSYNGTLHGGITENVDGQVHKGYSFDGNDDAIQIVGEHPFQGDEGTVIIFMTPNFTDSDFAGSLHYFILSADDENNVHDYWIQFEANKARITLNNVMVYDATLPHGWTAGDQIMMTLTWNDTFQGNETRFYTNNRTEFELLGDDVDWDGYSELDDNLTIGSEPDFGANNFFLGNISHIMFYNRSLTPTEVNLTYERFFTTNIGDPEIKEEIYPIFSDYWDDNATLVNQGIAHFNVSVTSTNGTVFLEIDGSNYTASNTTEKLFNISINLTNGTFPYYWGSWGNGSNNRYNTSNIRYYTVNLNLPIFSNYWDSNFTFSGELASFNVSVKNTNGTVILNLNGTDYTASNTTEKLFNISINLTKEGDYPYYWASWSNGTLHLYNFTTTRNYYVSPEAKYYVINISLTSEIFEFNVSNMTGVFQPYNQTDSIGVLTVHNNESFALNVSMRLNETREDITLRANNDSVFATSIILSTSWQDVCLNLPVDNKMYIWMWAVYNDTRKKWFPELEIAGTKKF
ncbi:MAG: hypothetical protein ACTSR3_05650 [Candidatus Helarchaeota archaeon]